MVVVGLVSESAMVTLGPMGTLVTPPPPSPRAFDLRLLVRPIHLVGLAETCILGAAWCLLKPLEDASLNLLAAQPTLASVGICHGEATRPGYTCPTLAQAAARTASSLRSAPNDVVETTLLRLKLAQTLWIEAMDAALPHATTLMLARRQQLQGMTQFEGGLVPMCSRLGRATGTDLALELARTQFEGSNCRLGPTLALLTLPGPAWRPALPLATRSYGSRWRTMRSGSPRGSGPRAPNRAATPPTAWLPSAHAWPRGPPRRDPSPPHRATTSRALTTTSSTRPPGSHVMRSPQRLLATIVS